jgi:hypothetical protein
MTAANPHKTRAALIESLQAVAARLGRRQVTQEDFFAQTQIPAYRVSTLFGTYNGLVRAAGLDTHQRSALTSDELLSALRDACVAAGGIVCRSQASRYGARDPGTYRRRWRSWRDALIALRDWAQVHDPGFPWLPALPQAGDDTPLTLVRSAPSDLYGAPLNIRGMLHEPVNEQGVLMLFGALASELDFAVERVTSNFPDCIAKQRVAGGWRRVRIEFEFESRNFLRHGHDPAGCDLIVCWQHNWPECPLEVLELRAEVAKRLAGRAQTPAPRPRSDPAKLP